MRKRRRGNPKWYRGMPSPNPNGKPKGLTDPRREYLVSRSPELLEKLVDMALDGDMRAMDLCINHVLPRLPAESRMLPVPLRPGGTSPQLAERVLRSAFLGRIGVDDAAALINALLSSMEVKERAELEERLAALEEKQDSGANVPWARKSAGAQRVPNRQPRKRHRSDSNEKTETTA